MIPENCDFSPAILVLPGPGGEIDLDWLADAREQMIGRWLAPDSADSVPDGLERLTGNARDRELLIGAALEHAGSDGLLVMSPGLELPTHFAARLARVVRADNRPPVLVFPGNHDPCLNPAAGLSDKLTPALCDAAAHLAGTQQWTPIDHVSSALLWLDATDRKATLEGLVQGSAWLFDGLYVHDSRHAVDQGALDKPAAAAALGPLRLALDRLASEAPAPSALPLIGCDTRPVTLHISHDWGGGVARWITDFTEADEQGHHLVLSAAGRTDGKVHGQRLRLYAAAPDRGLIGEWVLAPAIAGSVERHEHYAELLDGIIDRYGIGRVVISSLIGHSLDAFRTGLPTLQVLHDFYPAWPVLDHDPLEFAGNGGIDLDRAIRSRADGFLFAETNARQWQALTRAWKQCIDDRDTVLIAPTTQVAKRWERLCPGTGERIEIVAHGFDGWPEAPKIVPRPLADGRLNLVVVGRLSPGKGLGLLEATLPRLRQLARITLLGCGHHGMRLFGQAGVDIVLDYDYEELPRLIAQLAPEATLFLSTVAETWNYVLSETRALGLVPVATRTGSFPERIRHGVDGLLFDPDPESLAATIRDLAEKPDRLKELAASLAPEPGRAQAINRCNRLAPPEVVSLPPPQGSTAASRDTGAQSTALVEARVACRQLTDRVESLKADLAKRTAWARKHERLTEERTRWARLLDDELAGTRELVSRRDEELAEARIIIDERTRWALALNREFNLVNQRAHQLDDELRQVHASWSWRLTRPLRFASRALTNARQRRAWNPLTWPRLLARLVHNLRVYGFGGTLQLIQQSNPEPRGPEPQAVSAELPDDATVEPVRLPATAAPTVSIIVPVFNKLPYTAACLHSIVRHSLPGDYEVIVVDDCSTDDTAEFLDRCEGLKVVRNESNQGFIHSCNAGATEARGDYLVFLNNDTTVTSGWLDALIETFDTFDKVGAVGARLVYPDGRLQEAGGIIFSDGSGWNYGRGDDPGLPHYNFASECDYVSGACLAVYRDTFAEVDGFDARYAPAYYEDTDLCFRLRERGLQVICQPACTVVHHEGISSGTDEQTGIKRFQAVNREKFVERWREALDRQPEPVPGPEAVEQVEQARHCRRRGNVLVIDAVTPEPDKDSGSVRMLAMLEILRNLGWHVRFMPENLARVDRYTALLQRRGIEALYHPAVSSIEDWLKTHGERLDLVLVSRHYVLTPLIGMIRRHCPNACVIFDTVDLHFLREQRRAELADDTAALRMAERTRKAELKLMEQSDVTLVVSPVEQALLEELLPAADIRVLSNIHDIHATGKGWSERRDLLFVGGFQHPPNIDAAEWLMDEIFPRLRKRIPDICLHLIGSRMPESLRERRVPGITIHGFVEDLTPYLEGCRVSVAPLTYGAGVKGKVNQAMAWGMPVVATACAAEGMYLKDGEDILIADTTEDFVAAVERVYTDEALWQKLSTGGLANVERHFSIDAATRILRQLTGDSHVIGDSD